jgi:hypothetical protein
MLGLAVPMAETPPSDSPPDPPVTPQVPAEPPLPDTVDAKRLYLHTEAIKQRARELSEEVTQKMQSLDVPLQLEDKS